VKWGSGKSKFPLPVFGWAEKCKGFSLQLFPFSVGRTSEEIHTSFSHGPLGNDKTVGLSLSFLSFTLFFSRLLFPSLSDLGENSRSLSLSLSRCRRSSIWPYSVLHFPSPLSIPAGSHSPQPLYLSPSLSLTRALRSRSDTCDSLLGLLARIGAVLQRSIREPTSLFSTCPSLCPLRSG